MPAKIDITNKRFGKLVALNRKESRPGMWRCRCDCGSVKDVYIGHLRSGSTKSCGCGKNAIEDIIGRKFGYLTVLEYLYKNNKHSYWKCKCCCGNIIISNKNNLKRGNTKSCGCMSAELQEKTNMKKYGHKSSFQSVAVRKKFEDNNVKKYGVKYPAQDPSIALKTAKSQKNAYLLKHWKTKEEIVCVASYEREVVKYLNKNKIDFKWQHKVFNVVMKDGTKSTYRPDLYIIGRKRPWVEIKGYFRDDAKEKWEYFHTKVKPNSEIWDKGSLIKKGILK